HGDEEVGQRSAGEDQQALPGGPGVEPVGVGEVARLHASHAHVAEDREGADRVHRAAARRRPELGAGADRKLDHAHLEQLGEREVACLVGRDEDQEHACDPDHDQKAAHARLTLPNFSLTSARAQRSASRISGRLLPQPANAARVRSTVRTMALNGMSRARNAFTASSLAAFKTAGWPPPVAAASRARRTLGNRASSRSWNSRPLSSARGVGGTASGRRSGYASATAIGRRMSGLPSWALNEPSTNSTREWTTLCGWMQTVILSRAMP